LAPRLVEAYVGLAELLELADDCDQAAAYLRRAAALAPNTTEGRLHLV
jgi:Tetratricopeptide repeat